MKKIDWDRLWRDLDKWWPTNGYLPWLAQKKKIQSLVEAQLKPKRKT